MGHTEIVTMLHLLILLVVICSAQTSSEPIKTVLIKPSWPVLKWPQENDTWLSEEKPNYIIYEKDLSDFFTKVFTKEEALYTIIDVRQYSPPLQIFSKRQFAYVTIAPVQCKILYVPPSDNRFSTGASDRTGNETTNSTNVDEINKFDTNTNNNSATTENDQMTHNLTESVSNITETERNGTETASKTFCASSMSEAFTVRTGVLKLRDFLGEYLRSWVNSSHTKQSQVSFALLFDRSGEVYFNQPPTGPQRRLLFEISTQLTSCQDPGTVASLAANTTIKDVVVIAVSKCIEELLAVTSELHLPPTRFRWLLYATDGEIINCNTTNLRRICSQATPIIIEEKNRPEIRPLNIEDAVFGFIKDGLRLFLTPTGKTDESSCNCTQEDCSSCQEIFQRAIHEIPVQEYGVFLRGDTEDESIEFELYRLLPSSQTPIGNWSYKDGLFLSEPAYDPSFTEARLTVVVIEEYPFVLKTTGPNGEPVYSGYSIDVFNELAKRIGVSYTISQCDDGGYGVLQNGVWTGCIGNVVRGEADVVLGALTVTAERDTVVDFTLPYFDFAGIQILMKKQADDVNLFYYANVFTSSSWMCIGAVTVVTSALLWIFEKYTAPRTGKRGRNASKREVNVKAGVAPVHQLITSTMLSTQHGDGLTNGTLGHNGIATIHKENEPNGQPNDHGAGRVSVQRDMPMMPEQGQMVYTLGESVWFITGALTMAGGGDPPRSLSGRLLVAGFWFFSVIMMATFTANLAAFLTVSRMGMTINSLDDLVAQSDIKYSVLNQSSVMEYFHRMSRIEENFYERWKQMSLDRDETQSQDSLAVWDYPLGHKYGAMWRTIQETGLLSSTEEGVAKVKAGDFAFIMESPSIKYYVGKSCDLMAIGEQFSVRPYAIALKERSPYTNQFSEAILDLQNERLLNSLRLKWWEATATGCPKETGNAGLDLFSLTGTFIVAAVGVACGLLCLAVEHIITRLRKARERT